MGVLPWVEGKLEAQETKLKKMSTLLKREMFESRSQRTKIEALEDSLKAQKIELETQKS